MPGEPTDGGGTNVATERAAESAKSFTEAIAQIRQRADYAAKGLAGIGTAAITAIGYTKLADVFPDGGPWWAPWGLGAGVLLMIVAVGFLARRFYGASESVITRSDVDQTAALNDLSEAEKKTLGNAYRDTAELNGLDTLRAYEARGQRLERIADRFPDAEAKLLHGQAQQIFTEIKASYARAAAFVLRERATNAVFSFGTYFLISLFVIGWYGVAISADAMESKRTEEIAIAKSCAEARKEADIVEKELPEICGTPEEKPAAKESTPAEARGQGIEKLAISWISCEDAARKAGAGAESCLPLQKALLAAISP